MEKNKAIIEAILFSAGREVDIKELMIALELGEDEIKDLINCMKSEYENENRGIRIISVDNAYQICTKKEFYEYIYPVFDKRSKPSLSQAALETLAIIAYNPRVTRAEIESIRGVNSDGTIYKLLDYNLIEEAGKLDAPGRPTTYVTSKEFLKMFGLNSLAQLPDLPRYKLDENKQIVIDEILEEQERKNFIEQEKGADENVEQAQNDVLGNKVEQDDVILEAPMPEREEDNENNIKTNEDVENVETDNKN